MTESPREYRFLSVALLVAIIAAAWLTGPLDTSSLNFGQLSSTLRFTSPDNRLLTAWCAIAPGDTQSDLMRAMGSPFRRAAPGNGYPVNVSYVSEPLNAYAALAFWRIPVPKADGYAVWGGSGYDLLDTYGSSGVIAGMYGWPTQGTTEVLGCATVRTDLSGDGPLPEAITPGRPSLHVLYFGWWPWERA